MSLLPCKTYRPILFGWIQVQPVRFWYYERKSINLV